MNFRIINVDGNETVIDDEQMNTKYDEAWAAVSPEVRDEAVRVLREALMETDLQLIREAVERHGRHEWISHEPFTTKVVYDTDEETGEEMFFMNSWHFGPGMGIRNLLRQAGLTDDKLPSDAMDFYYGAGSGIQNWDDYYVQAVEAAAGAR